MDFRRVLLFFALSLLSIFLYSEVVGRFYGKRGAVPRREEVARSAQQTPPEAAVGSREPQPPAQPEIPAEVPLPPGRAVVVDTDLLRAEWTTTGARLRSLQLKHYRKEAAAGSPPLELVDVDTQDLPVGVFVPARDNFSDARISYTVDGGDLTLRGSESGTLVFKGSDSGLEIEKEVRFFGDQYPIDVTVRIRGQEIGNPATAAVTLSTLVPPPTNGGGGWFGGGYNAGAATTRQVLALDGKRLEHVTLQQLETETVVFDAARWAGFGNQYFITVAIPQTTAPEASGARMVAPRRRAGQPAVVQLEMPMSGSPLAASARLYFGPKDLSVLHAVAPELDRAIDFGWFWFVAVPLHWCLVAFHKLTGNYGVDIILVSTLIKVLFIPLTQKSMESMRAMQRLQPEMTKIRERFKDDAQRLQKEMMELYRRHRVNPLSGCLPMLLQIPFFVGLYNTLLNAIELRHAPFMLWIADLSAPERLMVGGIGIPMLAIAMGASMLVQQWMAPAAGDPAQRRMMMIMPVLFTFMFINFPSGLVLYWLVNNVLTIAQQYFVLNRTAG
jgi:YidC/Oxa1 family membrane protein insertase